MKTIPTTLFDSPQPDTAVRTGSMLVAQPLLSESFFNHGVIALVDYSRDNGALGTVLNNRTECLLHEVIDGVDPGMKVPVYNGGPLSQDRIYFLHNLGNEIIPGSSEFAPGLFIGGEFDAAREYINLGAELNGHIRFFVGYSGWSAGQLEEELKNRVWAVGKFSRDTDKFFTGDEDSYWHRAVKSLGSRYATWKYFPKNLRSN